MKFENVKCEKCNKKIGEIVEGTSRFWCRHCKRHQVEKREKTA